MIRRIHLIALFIALMTQGLTAQTINLQFKDSSLSDALLTIDDACDSITVNFVYDDLEDFRVTTDVSNASVQDAVRQVCGFYPMRIISFGNDIFVECTQRDSLRFIGRVVDPKGRPMRYANVALLSPVDSSQVNHGVANDDGYVVIPCAMREVILRVTHVGYRTYESRCKVTDMGEIVLSPDTKQLKGIKVSATPPPNHVTRRSYASLWKEANRLAKTDLPQKEMDVMRLIAMKARAEMNYGQLLAAELMYGSLQRTVSPDSLDSFISRLIAEEQSAATHSPMLAATYQTVLSKIIGENDPDSDEFSWLSTLKNTRIKYIADKYAGFHFTSSGLKDLITLTKKTGDKKWFSAVNKTLPILLVSGSEDPVGNYGKGVEQVYKLLKAQKLKPEPQFKLYEGARHEILNDFCRDEVVRDILAFIN